jgi:hypothetical protein
MKQQNRKKPYEKPQVTRVRLTVEHSVLQGCHSNLPNQTGADSVLCWVNQLCLKTPAE